MSGCDQWMRQCEPAPAHAATNACRVHCRFVLRGPLRHGAAYCTSCHGCYCERGQERHEHQLLRGQPQRQRVQVQHRERARPEYRYSNATGIGYFPKVNSALEMCSVARYHLHHEVRAQRVAEIPRSG